MNAIDEIAVNMPISGHVHSLVFQGELTMQGNLCI